MGDISNIQVDAPGFPDTCPNCGDTYNAVFPTSTAELSSPDKGKWCIWRGHFFIHEQLEYAVDK